MELGMNNTITTLGLLFVGVIIVSAVLIPITLDLVGGGDDYYKVGSEFSYTPVANLDDAEFTFSGSAMDVLTLSPDGTTVSGTLDTVGSYTLVVTATTTQPTQTATQTITIRVGEGNYDEYHDYRPLLLLVPTMLIVAFMVMALGRKSGGDDGGFGDDSGFGGGPDIAGKFGRRGFGKR